MEVEYLSTVDVIRQGLTFDDVLLVPKYAQKVTSREDPRPYTNLGVREFTAPIVSANMSTVTEAEMMVAMARGGGLGILHRFLPLNSQVDIVREVSRQGVSSVAVSLGLGDTALREAAALYDAGARIFCIDVAHGDNARVVGLLRELRSLWPKGDVTLIGGNVATVSGALRLAFAGADVVKVGIGPGSVCTTREVAGCGVPQLAAVAAISRALWGTAQVIADGGIRSSGDIVKALAVGAHAVMVGRIFAGTTEAPHEGRYFGMASVEAGRIRPGIAPEGIVTEVPIKGSATAVLADLVAGIQTGMSYQDALTLKDLAEDPKWVRVTNAGLIESGVRK